MNNKQGSAPLSVILLVVLVLALGVGYYVISHESPLSSPAAQNNPAPTSTANTGAVQTPKTATGGAAPAATGWKRYYFAGSVYLPKLSFEYPAGWTVSETLYRTTAEQAAGMAGEVAGLTLKPSSGSADPIYIGGYQAQCGIAIYGQRACFGRNTPVWTSGTNPATASVFVHVVASLR